MNLMSNLKSLKKSLFRHSNIYSFVLPLFIALLLSFITFELVVKKTTTNFVKPSNSNYATDNSFLGLIMITPPESVRIDVTARDYRAVVIDEYFKKYNSPLLGYADLLVAMCDKYGYPNDCTLLPAIAYTETKLCTQNITAKQFNCWGWGGSGENRVIFKDFDEAISVISQRMSYGYSAILHSPESISRTYCGAHCGTWSDAVLDQQASLQRMARDMGLSKLGD